METDMPQTVISGYPFPTPEVSVDPECQELYNMWLERREEKPVTLEDKLQAYKSDPNTRSQIIGMAIGMIVLCVVMKIVFMRIAKKRRGIEARLSARTQGRVVSTRKGAIGRRIVHYATVAYERDGFERQDEYLLDPAMFFKEGDEVPVFYDPQDSTLSMLGEPQHPDGREYDVVFIPFIVISVVALIWILL